MKEQQMTTGQAIAKEFWDEIRNNGHHMSERELSERIDAAIAAARAGTGDEKVKTRGEEVAEQAITAHRESVGVEAPSCGVNLSSNAPVFDAGMLQKAVAELIDAERTAAAEQMREACINAVNASITMSESGAFSGLIQRHAVLQRIRAIPTDGGKS